MPTDQHDQANGDPHAHHEELVAYLDGELDAVGTDRIENLLASNPAIRSELRRLEQTWDLLDELPVDGYAGLGFQHEHARLAVLYRCVSLH